MLSPYSRAPRFASSLALFGFLVAASLGAGRSVGDLAGPGSRAHASDTRASHRPPAGRGGRKGAPPHMTQKEARRRPPDRLALFRGLGAWIDLYDFGLSPRGTVATLAANGVGTLYLQTARSNTERAIDPRVGRWLLRAHAKGIKVVGWYLPYYANLERDVRRTVAIARYRYRGHRFDGAGIDIEYRGAVAGRARWNRRVAAHSRRVRLSLGREFPLAAIPPTPLQMRAAPSHWAGFPWRRIASATDATLLMSYWSDRRGCPRIRAHCAYWFTRINVSLTRRLTGEPRGIVHIIGGVGDRITSDGLRSFVRAARDAGADGASIYDVGTTRPSWWRLLRRLRILR